MERNTEMPEENEIASEYGKELSPDENAEIQAVSQFADVKEKNIKKLSKKFEETGAIAKLRLSWDSKIPDKDKRFYRFINFKSSKKEEVIDDIKKYIDFYEDLETAVGKICDDDEKTEEEKKNPHRIVKALKKKLKDMLQAAQVGQAFTPSSTVCKLHKEFLLEEEELGAMLKNMEIISLKHGMHSMSIHLQESVEENRNNNKKITNLEIGIYELKKDIKEIILQNEEREKSEQEKYDKLFKYVELQLKKEQQQEELNDRRKNRASKERQQVINERDEEGFELQQEALNDWQRNRAYKERQQVIDERDEEGFELDGARGISESEYEKDIFMSGEKNVVNYKMELGVRDKIKHFQRIEGEGKKRLINGCVPKRTQATWTTFEE